MEFDVVIHELLTLASRLHHVVRELKQARLVSAAHRRAHGPRCAEVEDAPHFDHVKQVRKIVFAVCHRTEAQCFHKRFERHVAHEHAFAMRHRNDAQRLKLADRLTYRCA